MWNRFQQTSRSSLSPSGPREADKKLYFRSWTFAEQITNKSLIIPIHSYNVGALLAGRIYFLSTVPCMIFSTVTAHAPGRMCRQCGKKWRRTRVAMPFWLVCGQFAYGSWLVCVRLCPCPGPCLCRCVGVCCSVVLVRQWFASFYFVMALYGSKATAGEGDPADQLYQG